jgi:two-component system OmpR family sensor kinase
MKISRLLVFVPAIAGLAISTMMNLGDTSVPILHIRIDIGTLLLIIGILISVILLLTNYLRDWSEGVVSSAAHQAVSDRRKFLRRLDHELKNPLTAILAGLANLSASEFEPPQRASLLSVEAQVDRLRDLVADLRKLSDLELRSIERTTVDLTQLLENLVEITSENSKLQDRKLNASIPKAPWPLPTIMGDWDLLFLALHNLIDNAIKFTQPGDTIELRAFEDNTEVVIEVADTGPGIPDEEVEHVWDELYRGEGARGIHGSGLGLALVRAIIQRHDGSVGLRSRTGAGTVFTVRLPVGVET